MTDPSYWILRCDKQLLILDEPTGLPFPQATLESMGNPLHAVEVGLWQGVSCRAADIERLPEMPGAKLLSLRDVFPLAGEAAFALAGRAVQLLDWQAQHRFCGRCGAATARLAHEHAMQCPQCALVVYPRISPAVMVLVRHGKKLLLARSPRFKPGVFSALAGFVEPGETLEQCAAREVREEVGVEITNLRYFGSQPWPFPNSLMVAFFADYAGGAITPDPAEIEAADWFELDALPLLPEPLSISRRLIEAAKTVG